MLAAALATIGGVALAPAHPVAAQQSCFRDDPGKGANGSNWECRWTQLDNSWPGSSTDPDCHAYCAFYIASQRYNYSDHVPMVAYGVDFEGDMRTAAADWSGQPYNSPWFGNCNCPSGGAFLTLGQKNSGTGGRACGIGSVTTAWQAQNITNDNHIVSAEADFATDFTGSWFDGPPPPTFGGGQYCDAINVAYHEVGHAFGASVAECIAYNYLAKAWDLAHAGPVVDPTPIVQATPLGSGCLVSAVDYQAWVTCVLGWEGWK